MTTETAELSHSSGFQASAAKSHHGRHHSRNKKGSDPFLQVSDDATKLSEPSTKHTISGENGQPPSLLADTYILVLAGPGTISGSRRHGMDT
ncbi:hypothetical protein D0864_16565 [Hortaea werneckii]|uniref:Uncharacterized protein n=1 Tax=Hortaea werneckii TaxID=91943 RepID=A0A3M7B9G1_HORWE|nr:hypothetical protein D0864_16565 [Hortaea werneckii]